jgi:cell division protein FtsL
MGVNENNIFNINEFQNNSSGQFTTFGNVFAEEKKTHLKFELQRLNLIVEQQNKEIDYLKQQVADLREMNQLLKNNEG